MGTRSLIAAQRDGYFESIYCHWDGYLDGVGKTLLEHYTDQTKLHALLALGDRSSLDEGLTPGYRDARGETGVNAQRATTLDDLFHQADGSGAEFVYVFVDGVWLYSDHGEFRAFGMGPDSSRGEISPWNKLAPVKGA